MAVLRNALTIRWLYESEDTSYNSPIISLQRYQLSPPSLYSVTTFSSLRRDLPNWIIRHIKLHSAEPRRFSIKLATISYSDNDSMEVLALCLQPEIIWYIPTDALFHKYPISRRFGGILSHFIFREPMNVF